MKTIKKTKAVGPTVNREILEKMNQINDLLEEMNRTMKNNIFTVPYFIPQHTVQQYYPWQPTITTTQIAGTSFVRYSNL
jgi:hypothetical protein